MLPTLADVVTMPDHQSDPDARSLKALGTIGYLALGGAVATAYTAPASGYEVSIYGATPRLFWAAIGVAMLACLLVSTGARTPALRTLGLAIGGGSVLAIAGLPVIRGYYYYGAHDPLTHLGWTREIVSGTLDPFNLVYPGTHTLSILVGRLTGYSLPRSLQLVVLCFVVVFVVFVTRTLTEVSPGRYAPVVGAFSAFLLLPINNVSVHLRVHPSTLTVFFAPFVIFLLVWYVTRTDAKEVVSLRSFPPSAALVTIAAIATVLYHPRQSANLLVLFAAASLIQLYCRRRRPDSTIAAHRPLLVPTAIFAAAYALWSGRNGWLYRTLEILGSGILDSLNGASPVAGQQTQSHVGSLGALGSGFLDPLIELFLKLFLVTSVYAGLAAVLMLGVLLGVLGSGDRDEDAVVRYLTAGFAIVAGLAAVYFVSGVAEQYFRYVGFLVLLATLLGAIAIRRAIASLAARTTARRSLAVLVVVFLLFLPLSLSVAFPSPYVFLANQHVTEDTMSGYASTFRYHDGDVPLAGIRVGPYRYHDGLFGVEGGEFRHSVSESELRSLADGDPQYVIITRYDVGREVTAYQELRYSREALGSVERQRGVSLVQASDGYRLYLVTGPS